MVLCSNPRASRLLSAFVPQVPLAARQGGEYIRAVKARGPPAPPTPRPADKPNLDRSFSDFRDIIAVNVAALNHAVADLPADRMRMHQLATIGTPAARRARHLEAT